MIIVADRGVNSKINLKYIKDAGYDYLMAVSIKSLNKKMKDAILDKASYTNILATEDSKEGFYCYKTLNYENIVKYEEEKIDKDTGEVTLTKEEITLQEKFICTYSDKRARKEQYDRGRGLDKFISICSNFTL